MERIYQIVSHNLLKMKARALENSPAADTLGEVALVMTEDLEKMGVRNDEVDQSRVRTAFDRYTLDCTRFPTALDIKRAMPRREDVEEELRRQKLLSMDPETREKERAKQRAKAEAARDKCMETHVELWDEIKKNRAARKRREQLESERTAGVTGNFEDHVEGPERP